MESKKHTHIASAQSQMDKVTNQFRVKGMFHGIMSGFTYGIYSVLLMVASGYSPLATAAGILAAPYVTSGLNDLLSGLILTLYNLKQGKLKEIPRTLKTRPGQLLIIGFLLGGPIASGAYLIGLYFAGAYAIPISATNALFGALFSAIFLKTKINFRVGSGMFICVTGAIIINWVKPEGAPNFTLGIICALIAAICWGAEGVFSAFGWAMLDQEVAVNIRQLISGCVSLILIVPSIGAVGLLIKTISVGVPVFWLALAGIAAGMSFIFWYKANSTIGTAIGMSLNITYAFWGVLFSIIFLHQAITPTIVLGSIIIIVGAILVTMNPLDFFKKPETIEEQLSLDNE
ncbi:EamA family transporter [Streptococcus iniae]|uniref:DMT family transporter n=1 Tax=Streptococcus iniae TaxID=1346 RepID=UPI000EF7978A|nr:DMT family transporter [Streptococcus iniae]RLU53376.1 EamA family transporter [Streptococcus iniae]RLU76633.1 EamA family transporter [Streptococcus iniae]